MKNRNHFDRIIFPALEFGAIWQLQFSLFPMKKAISSEIHKSTYESETRRWTFYHLGIVVFILPLFVFVPNEKKNTKFHTVDTQWGNRSHKNRLECCIIAQSIWHHSWYMDNRILKGLTHKFDENHSCHPWYFRLANFSSGPPNLYLFSIPTSGTPPFQKFSLPPLFDWIIKCRKKAQCCSLPGLPSTTSAPYRPAKPFFPRPFSLASFQIRYMAKSCSHNTCIAESNSELIKRIVRALNLFYVRGNEPTKKEEFRVRRIEETSKDT